MKKSILHPTCCAICNTENCAIELYPANFNFKDFNPEVFSARRLPDRIHYRMVRCIQCGLIRSDPVIDKDLLNNLYRQSTFDYQNETINLQRTYSKYLDMLHPFGVEKDSLLEIGCGNGFFLREALKRGYRNVRGIEPSTEAVSQAGADIREWIVCDILRPHLFPAASFNVICFFQVLDHLQDPVGALSEARRLLKPGGMLLMIHHNVKALSARLLGEQSPIVDLEHTYLYDPKTLSILLQKQQFSILKTGCVWNSYSLRYFFHLVPFPLFIKSMLLDFLSGNCLGRLTLPLPLGNLYLIAQSRVVP